MIAHDTAESRRPEDVLHYGEALYQHNGATLGDLREAVTTLEDTERTARRVFGSHPLTAAIEDGLQDARAALRDRETPLGFRVVGGGEKLVNDAPCNLGEPS